jgi:hypothetical protein
MSVNSPLKIELVRLALNSNKNAYITLDGSCMRPFLKGSDILEIKRFECGQLKIGDIVAIENSGSESRIIVHRIIRKRGEILVTKGDTCLKSDNPADFSRLLGKVVSFERNGRKTLIKDWHGTFGFLLGYLRLSWFWFFLGRLSLRVKKARPLLIW